MANRAGSSASRASAKSQVRCSHQAAAQGATRPAARRSIPAHRPARSGAPRPGGGPEQRHEGEDAGAKGHRSDGGHVVRHAQPRAPLDSARQPVPCDQAVRTTSGPARRCPRRRCRQWRSQPVARANRRRRIGHAAGQRQDARAEEGADVQRGEDEALQRAIEVDPRHPAARRRSAARSQVALADRHVVRPGRPGHHHRRQARAESVLKNSSWSGGRPNRRLVSSSTSWIPPARRRRAAPPAPPSSTGPARRRHAPRHGRLSGRRLRSTSSQWTPHQQAHHDQRGGQAQRLPIGLAAADELTPTDAEACSATVSRMFRPTSSTPSAMPDIR